MAGSGLTGGATSGDATLAVNFSSVQARIGSQCGQGSLMAGADPAGNPICTRGATAGSENVVVGSGVGTIAGALNTVMGNRAGEDGITGAENVAIGGSALSGTASSFNVAVGSRALIDGTTGNENTAVGAAALPSAVGDFNTAVGSRAVGLTGITGSENVGVGAFVLGVLSTGDDNVAVGSRAMSFLSTGSNNIAIGFTAGSNVTNGSDNIYIGNAGVDGEGGRIRIGNANTATFISGIFGATVAGGSQVFILPSGQLGTSTSSRRYKQDIADMGDASRHLFDLRPVTFRYRAEVAEGRHAREYGLIAEEVNEIYPDLVIRGETGEIESVHHHKLTPMLLNEVQRQQHVIDELTKRLSEVEAALRALTERATPR